jgi:molecular chaperone GrpE (heat shock protein)
MDDLLKLARLAETMNHAQAWEDLVAEQEQNWRHHLLALIEICDAFERTLKPSSTGEQPVMIPRRTFELIHRQLLQCLLRVEVERLQCVGEVFAPDLHCAGMITYTDSVEEDLILEEIVPGYRWRGMRLREPEVVIGRPTSEQTTAHPTTTPTTTEE